MMDTIRETPFGLVARILTGNKVFLHPEEKPDFALPEAYITVTGTEEVWRGDGNVPKRSEPKLLDTQPLDEDEDPHSMAAIARRLPPGTILVDWYGPDDPANPHNWSLPKKLWTTFVILYYTFAIYAGSAIVAYGFHDMSEYFSVSEIVTALTLSLFVAGYGCGPLFLAPLSEIAKIGRNPPYAITFFIFCVLQIPSALCNNFAGLAILRFLAGFMGSPPLATGGATITDMYSPRKSGYAMGMYGVAIGIAPATAPFMSGFAIMNLGWRWAFWVLLMIAGVGLLLLVFGMPETSAENILYRRAKRLRKLTGNPRIHSASEFLDAEKTFGDIVTEALVRPLVMTVAEPIVLAIDLYQGLTYMILYSYFESFPIVFGKDGYGWNLGVSGLPFLALTIGGMLSYAVYCVWSIYYWEPKFVASGGKLAPESYLTLSLYGGFCYPICLFWFGWTANRTHWISPTIASAIFGLADCWSFMPYLSYLATAYPKYAASALASNDFVRSMMGAAMPIVARPLFNNLGIDWGNSVFGFLAVVFIPLPFLLVWYGPWLRSKSPRATHFVESRPVRGARSPASPSESV